MSHTGIERHRSSEPPPSIEPPPSMPRLTCGGVARGTVAGMSTLQSTATIASIIGGEARSDAPGGRLTSTNPARTSEVVAEVLLGDAGTFVDACRAAREAQTAWAAVPAPARGRVIAQVGRIFETNKEALARLVTREVGKPYAESLGEVQEIIDTCDFFVGEGRRLYGQTVPSEMPDKQLFTFRMPVGVAAIITAGNFPVAVPAWYLVPAILCGNAVVWKPAEYSPALGDAMARIFHAGGVPGGVLNLVQAEGAATFAGLEQALEQRLVDKVGFTGSSPVGSQIGELCGRHVQSPCLELGGKNPMVVMDDADLDLAVEGALFAGFGTAGQRCTSLGTAIVHESIHDEFVRRLDERLRAAPIGDPTQDVLMGPMLDAKFAERFEDWLGLIRDHHTVHGSTGRGRITADNPREGFVGDPDEGLYYHPVVVDGVTLEDELYATETFGPIIGVASFSTFDEAMALANNHGYGLSSAIYTTTGTHAFRFRERITAGMVSVNNSTSGAEAHLPFGGNGKSGNGSRQSGIWVLDQFTRWQSMNWDFAGKLQKAQMDVVEIEAQLDFALEERAF
jgi:acyl-CoA reductase-like NAD-dependent aldehyde dehydrogenase